MSKGHRSEMKDLLMAKSATIWGIKWSNIGLQSKVQNKYQCVCADINK